VVRSSTDAARDERLARGAAGRIGVKKNDDAQFKGKAGSPSGAFVD